MIRGVLGVLMAVLAPLVAHAAEPDPGAEAFKREIDVRPDVTAREQVDYAKRLDAALARAGIEDATSCASSPGVRSPLLRRRRAAPCA